MPWHRIFSLYLRKHVFLVKKEHENKNKRGVEGNSMSKNQSGVIRESEDNKVDAIAAVVLIFCVAGMILLWVASH